MPRRLPASDAVRADDVERAFYGSHSDKWRRRGSRNALAVLCQWPCCSAQLPLSLKLVLVVLFVPQELSFFLGDLRLTFERLLLILLTPVVAVRLVQKVASGNYRFVASDLFVPLAARWMFVGPAVTYDPGYALHHSGPVVLEFLITYGSTRILLSGHGQALLFINMLCVLIVLVVMDAAFDTATGTYITREACLPDYRLQRSPVQFRHVPAWASPRHGPNRAPDTLWFHKCYRLSSVRWRQDSMERFLHCGKRAGLVPRPFVRPPTMRYHGAGAPRARLGTGAPSLEVECPLDWRWHTCDNPIRVHAYALRSSL